MPTVAPVYEFAHVSQVHTSQQILYCKFDNEMAMKRVID